MKRWWGMEGEAATQIIAVVGIFAQVLQAQAHSNRERIEEKAHDEATRVQVSCRFTMTLTSDER